MLDAKELLEKVDSELIIEIMEEHGSPYYGKTIDGRTQQDVLWFKTICHGGNSPKLALFAESKDFYCYTQCGRITFFDFIMKIEGCDFYSALKYIADKLGVVSDGRIITTNEDRANADFLRKRRNALERQKREQTSPIIFQELPTYPKSYLDLFEEKVYYTGWLKEGISPDSMYKYGIRWHEGENHIIIPHVDKDGKLVGIRRRSLNPEDANNKYMPELVNGILCQHPLTANLYGLYQNKEAIARKGRIIITEAEKSVLLSDTFYGDDSITVATCGFNISNQQIKILRDLNIKDVYLGFDKDYDVLKTREYRQDRVEALGLQHYFDRLEMLGDRLSKFFTVSYIIDTQGLLNRKDSPFDKGQLVFEKLLTEPNLIQILENKNNFESRVNIKLENNKYKKGRI